MAEQLEQPKPGEDEVCAYCKLPGRCQRCSGCRSVSYCSREHQKAHWKEHSANCRAYKLMENERLGRHYVALRRIGPGELVMREERPLLLAPQQESQPICLGCYVVLEEKTARDCPECGWPLCRRCTGHGPECRFTKTRRSSKVSIREFGISHPKYRCIGVLRALALRDEQPEAYEALSRLASGSPGPDFPEPLEVARFVKRFFDKLHDFDEHEIARLAGILQINGHELPTVEPALIAVYDRSSYLEHSCKANCSKSFTSSNGIVIRAVEAIEKGEHITICYTDPLWGTSNRRHHLLRTKFFDCTCERCSDPSEFGTMFNAIKCTARQCPAGSMLPRSFLSAELPDYRCDKCGETASSDAVDELLDKIGRDLAGMRKNDTQACRAFLAANKATLHDNHFYMTDARLALAQLIGQQQGGLPALDSELISEKILLCKKLNDLLKTIVPAENRVRGLILFEMHAAVAEFGRRQDKEQLYTILQEAKRLLTEAYQLLRYEPEILPEGRIARTAKRNLAELEVIMKKLCETALLPL